MFLRLTGRLLSYFSGSEGCKEGFEWPEFMKYVGGLANWVNPPIEIDVDVDNENSENFSTIIAKRVLEHESNEFESMDYLSFCNLLNDYSKQSEKNKVVIFHSSGSSQSVMPSHNQVTEYQHLKSTNPHICRALLEQSMKFNFPVPVQRQYFENMIASLGEFKISPTHPYARFADQCKPEIQRRIEVANTSGCYSRTLRPGMRVLCGRSHQLFSANLCYVDQYSAVLWIRPSWEGTHELFVCDQEHSPFGYEEAAARQISFSTSSAADLSRGYRTMLRFKLLPGIKASSEIDNVYSVSRNENLDDLKRGELVYGFDGDSRLSFRFGGFGKWKDVRPYSPEQDIPFIVPVDKGLMGRSFLGVPLFSARGAWFGVIDIQKRLISGEEVYEIISSSRLKQW